MPELPEVETLRRDLSATLTGRAFASVDVRLPKQVVPAPGLTIDSILGRSIVGLRRRAKFLLFDLSDELAGTGKAVDRGAVDDNLEFPVEENPDLRTRLALADDVRSHRRLAHDPGPHQFPEGTLGDTGKVRAGLEQGDQIRFVHSQSF